MQNVWTCKVDRGLLTCISMTKLTLLHELGFFDLVFDLYIALYSLAQQKYLRSKTTSHILVHIRLPSLHLLVTLSKNGTTMLDAPVSLISIALTVDLD